MTIELSNLTFTEQDDIIPASGEEIIVNTGLANTLAGNDRITGTGTGLTNSSLGYNIGTGFYNTGTLNTADGNDIITGIHSPPYIYRGSDNIKSYGILNQAGTLDTGKGNDTITGRGRESGINNDGTIHTDDGNDLIIGTINSYHLGPGIVNSRVINTGDGNDGITGMGTFDGLNNSGTLTTEEGNDTITGSGEYTGLNNSGTLNTGEGNDIVTATITTHYYESAMYNSGSIDTSDGNDIITGSGRSIGILNVGIINSGNGENSIISKGNFINHGGVFLGDGNDLISVDRYYAPYYDVVENFGFIGTGDGNDTITSTGIIHNRGVIETGNGDDSIIVELDDLESPHAIRGINNNGGAINMGNGNDSIIANEGFGSGLNSSGVWFFGEGEDYIKGYGSGDFYGGSGNDTLELTPGTYTVGIWGEGGESPFFTQGNQLMITSEFEKLIAGSTIYDFTSLTAGQIIIVSY
jgi:hypothetical protein